MTRVLVIDDDAALRFTLEAVLSDAGLVVEACDGIRYLIPLVFTALVFCYVTGLNGWMRVALAVAAIPVAIVANGIRVAAIVPLPALSAGPLHSLAGWLIFLLCLLMLGFVHWVIRAMYRRYEF